MANRVYQNLVHQLADAAGRVVGVVDDSGTIVSCSELGRIGGRVADAAALSVALQNIEGAVTLLDAAYCAFDGSLAVFVDGTDDGARLTVQMAAVAFANAKQYHDEKFDRAQFIKNVLMDNVLPGDLQLRSRELRFDGENERVVLLVRLTNHVETNALSMITNLFPDKETDFVVNLNENDIAVVKELRYPLQTGDLEKLARAISDYLGTELYATPYVGIGTVVTSIKEIIRSYKEAQISLEVGKIFDQEKTIIRYEALGIARLIYQLPLTLCNMFLQEVFKKGSIDSLDMETNFTILRFFENNLNVSETSRKLFVHRNTLVYRLEKIKKLTGLDLREFDDAIVFKVALMVKKYLDEKPSLY
ncbi:MAG: helix-turn-helix domain-containing protein [Oscillospiraceae bacterium]|jgi:carbohydrate diacid regulator|nr:helix-turn-helix domain-containing protein [Oscillospiraceae bacterium]